MFCCIVAERHLLALVAFRGGQGIPKAVTRNLSHRCFTYFALHCITYFKKITVKVV